MLANILKQIFRSILFGRFCLKMRKSEMHHQFWITKKTVQRKLGSKEDEFVISSDAELDSKIEVFKSIAETSTALSKIIDQYQERVCILSHEECVFGRFLKEIGKRSKTTGQSILSTGKAISYTGQQRMSVRLPLLRLQHEVEVFRQRAISDTQLTISAMEKERTEYRAALSWMKSSSTELDPDTGRGLDKFRMAQSHVRNAKQNFDSISLDSIQKIDLLAAARCNMYSHALVSYMSELLDFSRKNLCTLESISKAISKNPRYDFFVLKELSQNEENSINSKQIETIDKDQSLFFADEYKDKQSENKDQLLLTPFLDNSDEQSPAVNEILPDLNSNAPKQTDLNIWSTFLLATETPKELPPSGHIDKIKDFSFTQPENENKKTKITKSKTVHAWMNFFAELDPFGNLEEFNLKLHGEKINFQQT